MKLQIDFYSEDEVSIRIEFDTENPEGVRSELFTLACYTLRQFRNQGHHLAADATAGWLVKPHLLYSVLCDNPEMFPLMSASRFLGNAAETKAIGMGIDSQKAIEIGLLTSVQSGKSGNANILDKKLFSKFPKIVEYKGRGKKWFMADFPPFILNHKGFGFLGAKIPYYANHSIIALMRYLAKKHSYKNTYLDKLTEVGSHCAIAFLWDKITSDQSTLAWSLLDKTHIS